MIDRSIYNDNNIIHASISSVSPYLLVLAGMAKDGIHSVELLILFFKKYSQVSLTAGILYK